MRYFIDSEFADTGSAIHLVSIGIVASDGREMYGQSVEFDLRAGSDWVWQNVYPHLEVCPYRPSELDRALCCKHKAGQCALISIEDEQNRCPWRTREQLKRDILAFLDVEKYGKPELYGWCSGYDFVALCQLFGTMMDVPPGFPHYFHEFQALLDARGITDDMLPQQEVSLHHALADAKWLRHLWQWVQEDYEHGQTQALEQLVRDQHAYLLEIAPHSYQEGDRASHLREQWQTLGLDKEYVHG